MQLTMQITATYSISTTELSSAIPQSGMVDPGSYKYYFLMITNPNVSLQETATQWSTLDVHFRLI